MNSGRLYHDFVFLERETGFEPAAFALARQRSTPELFPLFKDQYL
jgi:hypothetical protein